MMARSILKSKKGVSILMVMVVMLILFIIGLSVIVAAANATNAELRQHETMICTIYAKNVATKLTKEMEGELAYGTFWHRLAQEAYDRNNTDGGGTETIEMGDIEVDIKSDTESRTIEEADVKIEFSTPDIDVNITPGFDPINNVEFGLFTEGQAETASIKIENMTAKITVTYRSSSYVMFAQYRFEGETLGANIGSEGGDGILQSGRWSLVGYYRG